MNLAADNATQSRATQGRAGIATNQVTCHATQYRTSSSVALGLSHIGTRTQRSGQHDQGHSFCKSFLHGLILHQGVKLYMEQYGTTFH